MYENTEPWDKNVPGDLIPAIAHLRKSFDEAHWGCGFTTKVFCYALLHNEAPNDPAGEFLNYLMAMKARAGPAATKQFHDLLQEGRGTPSAIFKACFDFYLEGVSIQALLIFKELAEIGRVHEKHLGVAHIAWAEAQTKHLIRSHNHKIKIWIRDVCDKQVYDPKEDTEERIFWRKWQAPMLLIMEPSRYKPYDAATVWKRNDSETSSKLLESFAQHYVLHLEIRLEKVVGNARLELAKQPSPIQISVTDTSSQEEDPKEGLPVTTAAGKPYRPTTTRREARKLDTQDMYKSWQKAYQAWKKHHPNESDVWYSRQIAKMEIARDASPETIRKHMKK